MTDLEQSIDLLLKLRAARRALEDTGCVALRGEGDARSEYREGEVYGRYVGVWWMLQMAINDVEAMKNEWRDAEAMESTERRLP